MSKFLVRVGYAALVVAIVGGGSVGGSRRGIEEHIAEARICLTTKNDQIQALTDRQNQARRNGTFFNSIEAAQGFATLHAQKKHWEDRLATLYQQLGQLNR